QRPRPGGGNRQAGGGATTPVPGAAAERRFHSDGFRGGGAAQLFQPGPGAGGAGHVARAHPRARRVRGVYPRSRGNQGHPRQRIFTFAPAPVVVHYGKALTTPISGSSRQPQPLNKPSGDDPNVQQGSGSHHRPLLQAGPRTTP